MSDWQPIETAPKDGTEILGWTCGGWVICWWKDAQGGAPDDPPMHAGWWGAGYNLCPTPAVPMPDGEDWPAQDQPTHWMPLPEPPEVVDD